MIRPRPIILFIVVLGALVVLSRRGSAQAFDSDLPTYVRSPRIADHEWRWEGIVSGSRYVTVADTALVERTFYTTDAAASYGFTPRVALHLAASHAGLGDVDANGGLLELQLKISDHGRDALALFLGAGAVRVSGTRTDVVFSPFDTLGGDSLVGGGYTLDRRHVTYTNQIYHAIASWSASADSFASYLTIDAEIIARGGNWGHSGYTAVGARWSHGRFRLLGEAALLPDVQRAIAGGLWLAPARWLEFTGYYHYLIDDRRTTYRAGLALRR